MTRFKDFTNEELRALQIKIDDFQVKVDMDVGTYVKSMNRISREISEEIEKRKKQ